MALDGLAIVVDPAIPIRQLSLDQIASIFSGQITNWNQAGGKDAPVVVHRRDDKSGTYDTFNSLVLAPRKVKMAAQAKQGDSKDRRGWGLTRPPNQIL